VVVDVGSRDEEPGVNDGVCHMMEAMAFKTTTNR
jgi:predicted Zn-dependent peptidase